jgi:hypothetical protein
MLTHQIVEAPGIGGIFPGSTHLLRVQMNVLPVLYP